MDNFCPNCGIEVRNKQIYFCGECGAELKKTENSSVDSVAPVRRESSPEPANHAGAFPIPSSGTHFAWKRFAVPSGIAGILLLVVAGGAFIFFGGANDEAQPKSSPSSGQAQTNTNDASAGSANSSIDAAGESLPTSSNQSYISDLDPLIAENNKLESQIVSKANEINSVAPAGINSSLLTSISGLENNFKNLRVKVTKLNTPRGFSKAQSDIIKLIDYNVARCGSLYRGTQAWGSRPDDASFFQGEFRDGQTAKEAYQTLYPSFEKEYEAAKRGN